MPASLLLAVALQSATAAPQLNANLQPLAFLVGSCWRGTFPDGRQTDTHCFTAPLGGAFVRDRHIVENGPRPYAGESLYRWDAAAAVIRFDYYATDGGHTAGTALPAANGLTFPQTRTQSGRTMQIETVWTRDGADAYLVRAEIIDGANRRAFLDMRMARVGPAPAER